MNKPIKSAIATMAVAVLSLGAIGPAAAAPYGPTIATRTTISPKGPVKDNTGFHVTIAVRSGNAYVHTGKLRIVFAGQIKTLKITGSAMKIYFRAPNVKRKSKRYPVNARYIPSTTDNFATSSGSTGIKVIE